MDIERKMGAVDGEIASENLLEHPSASTADRLEPGPKESVMDDEQIHAALDRALDRPRGGIYRRADLRNRARVLHLQAVQSILPIVDFANAQMFVRVGN